MTVKLAAISGSTREGSINVKLARLVVRSAQALGYDAAYVDLREYAMPLYDADVERVSGPPVAARALKLRLREADALFIASPEYNASVTPLLKNTLDWLSRPGPGEEDAMAVFRERPMMLGAATNGAMGGLRGLIAARQITALGLGAVVLPDQIAVPNANTVFDDDGRLTDEKLDKLLVTGVHRLARMAERMRLAA